MADDVDRAISSARYGSRNMKAYADASNPVALVVEMFANRSPDLAPALPRGKVERLVFAAIAVSSNPQSIPEIEFWTGLESHQVDGALRRMMDRGDVESAGLVPRSGGGRWQTYRVAATARGTAGG